MRPHEPSRARPFWLRAVPLFLLLGWPSVSLSQTVTSTRPRVFLTPARLTKLKDYANRNTLRWQSLKARADAALTQTTDTYDIPNLGLVYQVTGDARYATRAINELLIEAVPSNTLTRDSYFDYRDVIPAVAAGFDWCYDRMTTAQRQQVATWLMDRC